MPSYRNTLTMLAALLGKLDDDALLAARLADDMFPLATQIRYVCNMPGEAMERLTGAAFTSREEDPATLEEARELVERALAEVEDWSGKALPDDDRPIALELPNGMAFDLTAGEYVRDWALPQLYFHGTAAYAIARAKGAQLGKADYVGHMFRYFRKPG